MEGFNALSRHTDTHATQYFGDDSVVARHRIPALLHDALWEENLSEILQVVSVRNVEYIRLLKDLSLQEWGPAFKSLEVGARRIVLRKILDSYAVFKVIHEKLSRIFQCPELEYDLNRIRECFYQIQKKFAPSSNDVREACVVVVAAVVLFSYVYLYLTGCGSWDGCKAESSSSLDYRDTYIAIVLFRGAYVWIKFRDVASPKPVPKGAVRILPVKDGRTTVKYEPRFKPHNENGTPFSWIYLGRYDSRADAEVVFRMAASCYDYGKDYGTPLDLAGDGREFFTITPEFTPEEQTLSGKEKQDLVKERVKELYKCYKTEKDAINLPPTLPGASLDQELQNRRLQSEILSEQQQKEDLAFQLQQSQHLQRAQQFQIQHLQSQVEDVQRQLHHLQQAAQFQVPNLQPQLQHLQQQQREEEWFTLDDMSDIMNWDPIPEEAGTLYTLGDIQLMDETTMKSPPDFGDNVHT